MLVDYNRAIEYSTAPAYSSSAYCIRRMAWLVVSAGHLVPNQLYKGRLLSIGAYSTLTLIQKYPRR